MKKYNEQYEQIMENIICSELNEKMTPEQKAKLIKAGKTTGRVTIKVSKIVFKVLSKLLIFGKDIIVETVLVALDIWAESMKHPEDVAAVESIIKQVERLHSKNPEKGEEAGSTVYNDAYDAY